MDNILSMILIIRDSLITNFDKTDFKFFGTNAYMNKERIEVSSENLVGNYRPRGLTKHQMFDVPCTHRCFVIHKMCLMSRRSCHCLSICLLFIPPLSHFSFTTSPFNLIHTFLFIVGVTNTLVIQLFFNFVFEQCTVFFFSSKF